MEASETLTQLPLDFSVTMMNIKIKSEMNNNTSMFLSQNNQQSSSAFKVVQPRNGKTDGKLNYRHRKAGARRKFFWKEENQVLFIKNSQISNIPTK